MTAPRRSTLKGWRRWVACFDSHGDQVEPAALASFRDFTHWWKPDIRIHGGDIFDFRWLRRAASDEEKAESIEQDFEAGLALLGWYRPTAIVWGNHDWRLHNTLETTSHGATKALLSLMLERIESATAGSETVPYCKRAGVYPLGNYKVIHGYGTGIGAVRKAALVYGNCLMGHLHRNEQHTCERLDRATCYAVGCLCKLDLGYNRASIGTLMQEHGWAYGLVSPRGQTVVWRAQRVDGVWVLPSEFRA